MTGIPAMDGTVTMMGGGREIRERIPTVITTTAGADNAPGVDLRHVAFYNVMK